MRKVAFIFLVAASSVQGGLSKLEAISMIETGDNDRAIGRAGEVSRYQIKPHVWREYSTSRAYADARISTTVADQHLKHLENLFLKIAGREPTDFDRYVLWNAGLGYYSRVKFSPAAVRPIIRERARRYANLRQKKDPSTSREPLLAMSPALPGRKNL